MRHTRHCVMWGSLLLALYSGGQGRTQETVMSPPERRGYDPEAIHRYEQMQALAARYRDELSQIPGVYTISAGVDRIIIGIFVHTDAQGNKPATLPPALQAIPPTLDGHPVVLLPVYILPPPPGVIVLEPLPLLPGTETCPPESVRTWNLDHFECFAVAGACPPTFREETQFDWRFCLSPDGATLPNPMTPPIAGIPFEKVEEIWARRNEEITRLPGVHSAGIGAEGIEVETDFSSAVPSVLEGVPVIVKFVQGGRIFMGADLQGYHLPDPD